jgi:hypothetical protein
MKRTRDARSDQMRRSGAQWKWVRGRRASWRDSGRRSGEQPLVRGLTRERRERVDVAHGSARSGGLAVHDRLRSSTSRARTCIRVGTCASRRQDRTSCATARTVRSAQLRVPCPFRGPGRSSGGKPPERVLRFLLFIEPPFEASSPAPSHHLGVDVFVGTFGSPDVVATPGRAQPIGPPLVLSDLARPGPPERDLGAPALVPDGWCET